MTAGAFVITPAVLNGLGDSAYGGWLLMNAFISYLRLLDQGTPAGAMKYGAGALDRGDTVELARIFNTTAAAFGVVGILAGVVSVAFSFVLPHAYASILSGQGATIALLGGAMALDLLFRTYGAALRTRSLFLVYDGIELITYVIFKLGLVLYFRHTLSYRVLAYITLAETITRNILVISSTLIFCPWVRRLRPLRADKATFRRIAILGIAVSIIQVADVVRFQLDSSVIGYFIPNAATLIAIFGVGARVPSISYAAIAVIGSVMMPRFAVLSEKGDREGLRDLLRKSSLATGLASTYVLVNAAVLGPHFLNLWLKKPWTPRERHHPPRDVAGLLHHVVRQPHRGAAPVERAIAGPGDPHCGRGDRELRAQHRARASLRHLRRRARHGHPDDPHARHRAAHHHRQDHRALAGSRGGRCTSGRSAFVACIWCWWRGSRGCRCRVISASCSTASRRPRSTACCW